MRYEELTGPLQGWTYDERGVIYTASGYRTTARQINRNADFWEHLVRDDNDFAQHMDYVHYNPVKHGHVRRVADWPWSTFHRCVRSGLYAPDWGQAEPAAPDFHVGE